MGTIVFSCGFASGGTDLIKNILNAHPDIYIASEITSLAHIVARGYSHDMTFSGLAEVESFQKMRRVGKILELDFSIALTFEKLPMMCIAYH